MKLKKILLSIFNNLPMVLAGVALFTIIVLEGMQAIGRYAFKQTFLFVDDIAVICFAWTICAGCAAAYQQKAHYGLMHTCEHTGPGEALTSRMESSLCFLSLLILGFVRSHLRHY